MALVPLAPSFIYWKHEKVQRIWQNTPLLQPGFFWEIKWTLKGLYRVQHETTTASQQDFLLHELYCNQTYNSQTITDKVNQMEYYLNNSKDRHEAMTMPHMDLWFRQAKNDCSTFKIWPDLTGSLWWEWPHKRETSCRLTVTWWKPVVEQEMITFLEKWLHFQSTWIHPRF